MGINAVSGPNVTFGLTRTSSGGVQEYNEERAPDLSDLGYALGDPRAAYLYRPGSPVGTKIYGWWGGYGVIDCAPGTISTNAVALVQTSTTAGTVIVLSSVNNSVVTIGVTMTPADGSSQRTVIALDSTYAVAPRGLTFGSGGTVNCWDPTTSLQRQLTISKNSTIDDTAGTYTIQGFDMYGFKVTETITGTSSQGSSNYVSRKTYKYIQSITVGGTPASSQIAVGVNDTYGFPLAVHQPAYVQYYSGGSTALNLITAIASVITTAATATATSTTADVRGTILSCAVGTASNSTAAVPIRLLLRVYPTAQDVNLTATTVASSGAHMWLGVDQFSS